MWTFFAVHVLRFIFLKSVHGQAIMAISIEYIRGQVYTWINLLFSGDYECVYLNNFFPGNYELVYLKKNLFFLGGYESVYLHTKYFRWLWTCILEKYLFFGGYERVYLLKIFFHVINEPVYLKKYLLFYVVMTVYICTVYLLSPLFLITFITFYRQKLWERCKEYIFYNLQLFSNRFVTFLIDRVQRKLF